MGLSVGPTIAFTMRAVTSDVCDRADVPKPAVAATAAAPFRTVRRAMRVFWSIPFAVIFVSVA
jgi:hypothetical protein